ncbi:MAG: US12 family protein [Firmicutes bacterium]|nr:US12 family protein [Bacillota bacterium]
MSQGMASLSNKKERMYNTGVGKIVSERMYNLVIGGVIVWGVFVNALMCRYLAPMFYSMNWLVLLIGYFVLSMVGISITYKSKSPLVSFIGYNMVVVPVGAVLSVALQGYSTGVIFEAFVITTGITLTMMFVSGMFPGTFAGMGRMLFVSLIGLLVAQLICSLFGIYPQLISYVAALIFSLYIGYDWVKAQMYVKTVDNAVDSALDIYLDIINLFIRVLAIVGNRDR